MSLKRIFSAVFASVTLVAGAFAADNDNWGWGATQDNEDLYTSMLAYLKTVQTGHAGEPVYFLAQNLKMELEAAHESDPYAWLGQVHRFCDYMESVYAPTIEHPNVGLQDRYARIRRDITRLRDYPMHEVHLTSDVITPSQEQINAFNASNKQRLQYARDKFFDFLSQPVPEGELHVVKLYSCGVVLKTSDACIGMDIADIESYLYSSDRRTELAEYLDALYLTHCHGDHFDLTLLRKMLMLGKPVVLPKNDSGTNILPGSFSGTRYLWGDNLIPDGNGVARADVAGKAYTQMYLSAQSTMPCILYYADIDGWKIIHVGDNNIHENEVFYEGLDRADVVFSPVFQGVRALFEHTLAAANPDGVEQVYINIHENEYKHKAESRVTYKYLWSEKGQLGDSSFSYPSVAILDCGEHITFTK